MATQDDQPRPDLDAALDAVLPTLSAVGDERTAASLRRTRLALADQRGRLRSGWTASPWRWALPAAVALTVALIAVSAWLSRTPGGDGPRVVVTVPSPTSAPLSPAPSTAAPSVPAPRQVEPTQVARAGRVTATSAPPPIDAPRPRPDPVLVLARALEAIPESAWDEAMARATAPIGVAELSVAPIVVAPLVTPPIADAPPAPPIQGEP